MDNISPLTFYTFIIGTSNLSWVKVKKPWGQHFFFGVLLSDNPFGFVLILTHTHPTCRYGGTEVPGKSVTLPLTVVAKTACERKMAVGG